jgi:hypothetical protein
MIDGKEEETFRNLLHSETFDVSRNYQVLPITPTTVSFGLLQKWHAINGTKKPYLHELESCRQQLARDLAQDHLKAFAFSRFASEEAFETLRAFREAASTGTNYCPGRLSLVECQRNGLSWRAVILDLVAFTSMNDGSLHRDIRCRVIQLDTGKFGYFDPLKDEYKLLVPTPAVVDGACISWELPDAERFNEKSRCYYSNEELAAALQARGVTSVNDRVRDLYLLYAALAKECQSHTACQLSATTAAAAEALPTADAETVQPDNAVEVAGLLLS